MQPVSDQKTIATKSKNVLVGRVPFSTFVLLTSVALVLIGIFAMSAWAEASAIHHGLQHAIIFLSGVGVGGSLIAGYQDRKAKSDES